MKQQRKCFNLTLLLARKKHAICSVNPDCGNTAPLSNRIIGKEILYMENVCKYFPKKKHTHFWLIFANIAVICFFPSTPCQVHALCSFCSYNSAGNRNRMCVGCSSLSLVCLNFLSFWGADRFPNGPRHLSPKYVIQCIYLMIMFHTICHYKWASHWECKWREGRLLWTSWQSQHGEHAQPAAFCSLHGTV